MLRILVSVGVIFSGLVARASMYNLDAAHSAISFKIKHLVAFTVNGRFDKYEGTIDFDEASNKLSKVEAKIDLDTINTSNADRDKHLRSADFFGVRTEKGDLVEAKRYMTFVMKDVKMKGKKFDKVIGDLTINGITKPVTLNVDYGGAVTDPFGNEKIGFTATTKIVRKDFGITFNKPMEKIKGMMIGDDVDVTIEAEATKAKEAKEVKEAKAGKPAEDTKKK